MPVYPSPRAKYDIADPASYSGTGNTVYDLSGNNYDLTLANTTYQSTVEATSLIFNGSTSSAVYNGSIGVDTGDPFTFFMWTNILSFTGSFNIFFTYGQDDGVPLLASRYSALNQFRFETGSSSNTIAPAINTQLNAWHCYCITYDATTYKLYYDGSLVGSIAGSRYIGVPTKLSLGNFDNTGIYYTNMKFGYLEAWDQDLTAGEVLSKYQETQVNFQNNLVTYLDFLDPACFTNGGTAVNDLSAANNDWTLENLSYTYNPTLGTLALSGCRFTSNLQGLLGSGDVSFSLSYWNYFDSTQYDIVYYNGNYPNNGLHIDNDNANSKFKIRYGFNLSLEASTSVVTMDDWHNITYIYDHTTSTSTVYVDNAVALTFVGVLSQGVSTGYPGVQFADFWNGTGLAGLGLVYFYTRAISNLEVSNIYNDNVDRFYPPAPSVMGGRIFGEGLNG
jgi:hypothetical protein